MKMRNQREASIGKKVGITFGVILAVLVVAYVGMAFYFDSHFMFNTTINGNNFALKSVAQVEKIYGTTGCGLYFDTSGI